jgi:hypothetical protein
MIFQINRSSLTQTRSEINDLAGAFASSNRVLPASMITDPTLREILRPTLQLDSKEAVDASK